MPMIWSFVNVYHLFLLALNGDDDANAPPFNGLTANLWIFFFLSQNINIKANKPRDQIQIGVWTNSLLRIQIVNWSRCDLSVYCLFVIVYGCFNNRTPCDVYTYFVNDDEKKKSFSFNTIHSDTHSRNDRLPMKMRNTEITFNLQTFSQTKMNKRTNRFTKKDPL